MITKAIENLKLKRDLIEKDMEKVFYGSLLSKLIKIKS